MSEKIALGTPAVSGVSVDAKPETLIEQLHVLVERVNDLTKLVNSLHAIRVEEYEDEDDDEDDLNTDMIPVGTPLIGTSTRGGTVILNVNADGYYANGTRYDSLSAAAEAVSGVRRSGWTFWKTFDGRTAKEVFGRK